MPSYLITFKYVHNDTYSERFANLIARLDGGQWWAETGSTLIVHDEDGIDDFCRRIFDPTTFDERVDIAVVFDLDLREGRARGKFRDYGLFTILPWLERF